MTSIITPFVGSATYNDYYDRLNKVLGAGSIVGTSNTAASTPAYILPATRPAAPAAPVAPVAAPAAPATPAPVAPATPSPSGAFPTAALQPGSTDAASVRSLQDYLVSQGFMTREQASTGYGTYGPQTTAAVAALQKKYGVDNSSGVGYFGPRTIAALQGTTPPASTPTPTAPGTPAPAVDPLVEQRASIAKELGISDVEAAAFAKPSQTSEQIYTGAYKTAGLADLKTKIQALSDEIARDRQTLADAVGKVNENPFLIEQSRVGRGKRILDQAEQSINNKLSNLSALENLYKQGVDEISAMVTRSNSDFTQNQQLASAKLNYLQAKAERSFKDFEASRTSPSLTGSSETGYYRYDPTTKKFVQVIPPSQSAQFSKLPNSYQEWILAGKPGTYASFTKSKSPGEAVSFNPTAAEKSLVQRFLSSDAGREAGASASDIPKIQEDPAFFYYVMQKAVDAGFSTQI